jgi:CelD/BcsL family acetyltransferase involved in cellulose biosynthesis
MKVEVVLPDELGPGDLEVWHRFQSEDPRLSSPFLAPEFAQAVGRARDDARVAVIDDGGVAGYFAFQLNARHGVPIGATICDTQAVVCHRDLCWDARWLVHSCGLDVWQFDHLVIHQDPFAPFHAVRHSSPTIDLSGGHDDFLESVRARSKNVIAQVARRRRKLTREVGPVTTTWDSADPEVFAAMVKWKSDQYQRTGTWDRFEDNWIRDVLTEMLRYKSVGCSGVMAATHAGDRLAAVHVGLLGGSGLSWWFPVYDPDLSQYSPGLVMLLDLAEQAAQRGIRTIDLGRGEHSYKLRVATGAYDLAEGQVPAA